jgi:hypothetical protein
MYIYVNESLPDSLFNEMLEHMATYYLLHVCGFVIMRIITVSVMIGGHNYVFWVFLSVCFWFFLHDAISIQFFFCHVVCQRIKHSMHLSVFTTWNTSEIGMSNTPNACKQK